MQPTSKLPFLVTAAVTAAVALAFLGRPPSGPGAPAPEGAEGAAYVDSRVDVPHRGAGLAPALRSSLDWLARHQYPEGMWSARSYMQMCEGRVCVGRGSDEHDVGVTALAALALLESGLVRPKYEEPARRALGWLAARQDEAGCFGPRVGKFMYGHSIATLAFARAYPVLGDPIYKHHAARGVRFLETARNPGLAWRYGVRDGENDTSVAGWAGAALAAARSPDVEIPVDPRAFDGILHWLAEVTGERYYDVSYARRGGGIASVRGVNDHFESNEGLTAVAVWLRLQAGASPSAPEVRGGAQRLLRSLPVWNREGTSVDFCAWFAGTRALAAGGDRGAWEAWSPRVRRALLEHQRKFNEGCLAGSWDPEDKWGREGGRVYATAMNVLTFGILNTVPDSAVVLSSK